MVGLTRDGGNFSVEYNNRKIEADGDRGYVQGRIIREEATPKLEISHLELLTSLDKFHSGIEIDTTTKSGYTTVTGTGKVRVVKGINTFKIVVRAENGSKKTYTLNVVRKS